ncbi:hypothetical protein AAES_164422 [Amazona aestiva]|uniref:Uncharacterized protein n=1 Tax=Amazona aestiva TaxID=12930 RepID=A0A0Q3LTF0_AMAAE|nr:hypothetical protein AAES_164422 [Amazona aestiva]
MNFSLELKRTHQMPYERQHGIAREAGISVKDNQLQFCVSLIVLEPAFWDNYQILYSSKLLNGTEALWIIGHMMRKFSCPSRLLLPDTSPSVSRG